MNAHKMVMSASQIRSNCGPSVCSKILASIVHSLGLPTMQESGWYPQFDNVRELAWGDFPTTRTTDDVVVGLVLGWEAT